MTFKKRISLVLVVMMASVGVGLSSTPAVAAAPVQAVVVEKTVDVVWAAAALAPTCPVDEICMHDGGNWEGSPYLMVHYYPFGGLLPNHCYNLDSTWDRIIDSVWWNADLAPNFYAEWYSGRDCTVSAVTRAVAYPPAYDQMRTCNLHAPTWIGPCTQSSTSGRIRSWAFTYTG